MIRQAVADDYDLLGQVMYDAVHAGPSPYTPAQRNAWIAAPRQGAEWQAKLASQFVVLSQDGHALNGFMTLRADGYLDLAFIAASARGTGLFRKLYEQIETRATTLGLNRIWTHASLMAQPAFATMGFGLVQHEVVARAGQNLARAEMEKRLSVDR